jgi:hypothetical protein
MKIGYNDTRLIAAARNGTTHERLWANAVYGDEIFPITSKEQEIKQRVEAAHALLCSYHSIEQSVPLLHDKFGISSSTAYRDCQMAIRLYGDINHSSKEGMRHIYREWATKVFQMAARDRNIGEMNKALTNLVKITGLDKEDPQAFSEEMIQQHSYVAIIAAKGDAIKIDLNKIDDIPIAERGKLANFFEGNITDVEAEVIMKS